jgi:hypothetical protein
LRGWLAVILGALLLSGALSATARAESYLCAAWAGEIEPLPSVSDPDPLRAAWAGIRADQLAEVARKLEGQSRALANRVWRHASCLDPGRLDFARARRRTAPVRWVRPEILGAEVIELEEGQELPAPSAGWSGDLGDPIRVVVARTPTRETSGAGARESFRPSLPEEMGPIAAAEEALQEARFELALEWVERGRGLLEGQEPTGERPRERARLEVLAATAEIALGREEAARASLERALRAQPELRLDPARHSPKLIRLFEEARGTDGTPP